MKPLPFRLLLALSLAPVTPAALRAAEPAPGVVSSDPRFQIPATDDSLPGAGPMRRAEWFQKVWTERRSEFARRAPEEHDAIVFLGDSITHGWSDVGSLFPGVKVANRGIGGDTTRGVLYRLQDDVIALRPRAVVLLIGTNDLEEYAEPATIAANLKLILAALKRHDPAMPVVLCTVFPSSATKTRPANRIRRVNELYAEAVKDEPQVTLLDTWPLFADVHGDANAGEFPDLLHPNGIGYAKWSAALHPILETLGLIPAWPDDAPPEAGFQSLANGRDLAGWSGADQPALDGKTETADRRYVAKNGRLVATVARQGEGFRRLTTTRTFPRDFVLKLEFRASPDASGGLQIRGPQLACRDYALAGPFAILKTYRPLDWNEIVVTVNGGLAHATCNGEVLVDAMPVPDDGPIGLVSERGQIEYRRIRIQER